MSSSEQIGQKITLQFPLSSECALFRTLISKNRLYAIFGLEIFDPRRIDLTAKNPRLRRDPNPWMDMVCRLDWKFHRFTSEEPRRFQKWGYSIWLLHFNVRQTCRFQHTHHFLPRSKCYIQIWFKFAWSHLKHIDILEAEDNDIIQFLIWSFGSRVINKFV